MILSIGFKILWECDTIESMSGDIVITTPKSSDAETMAKWGMENGELKDSDEDQWYSAAALRKWIAHPHEDIILVARKGKKLVGMCLVHGMRGWAYGSSLYIDRQYRGNGIGTALLTAMIKKLKQRKIQNFAILVNNKNSDAKTFYCKHGFTKGYLFRWMGKKI